MRIFVTKHQSAAGNVAGLLAQTMKEREREVKEIESGKSEREKVCEREKGSVRERERKVLFPDKRNLLRSDAQHLSCE